jgi:hypothetical protein
VIGYHWVTSRFLYRKLLIVLRFSLFDQPRLISAWTFLGRYDRSGDQSERRQHPMPELPFRIIVHSNKGFEAFAREQGYDDATINPPDDPFRFSSIADIRDGIHWLHIPMWRLEVEKEEFQKYPVTFV